MKKLVLSALVLCATPLLAHPGHGADTGPSSLVHWFTHVDHLAVLGVALALVAGTAYLAAKKRKLAKAKI